MGTSVKMIDRTYGHLVAGADAYERELLDTFDARREALDTWWTRRTSGMPRSSERFNQKSPANAELLMPTGATGLDPATSGVTGRRSNQLSYAPLALGEG